jgi:hypothetical protein
VKLALKSESALREQRRRVRAACLERELRAILTLAYSIQNAGGAPSEYGLDPETPGDRSVAFPL